MKKLISKLQKLTNIQKLVVMLSSIFVFWCWNELKSEFSFLVVPIYLVIAFFMYGKKQ